MARAQGRAALRDERFRRHQEGVRAGTEPPGFLDRLESSSLLDPANPRYFARYVNADWPLDARPDEASLRLASAWLTWVGHGPAAGPDGVEVRIWIRSAGQDLPFRYAPADQGWVRRRDLAARGNDYTVCIRRLPAGRTQAIRTFASETSARWHAVGLAQKVREVGITALRPGDIPAGPRPTAGLDHVLVEGIFRVGLHAGRGFGWLPRQARAQWRQARTGRRLTARAMTSSACVSRRRPAPSKLHQIGGSGTAIG